MSDDLILPEAPPRVRALVYDAASGRIEVIVTCATLATAELQATTAAHPRHRRRRRRRALLLPGRGADRAAELAFDKTRSTPTASTWRRLPSPGRFSVTIDGTDYEVEDVLEIASDMPATYRVELDHFPYLPLDVEIVAE